jgi:hypothetical protein
MKPTVCIATAIALCLGSPSAAHAQTVRGQLAGADGEEPAPTLVALLDAAGKQRATTLTDTAGRFVLRAPAAGEYTLRAERIGYNSITSAPMRLEAGETLPHALQVPSEPVRLPARVEGRTGASRCTFVSTAPVETATAWEEARKALNVARHTTEQRVRHQVIRYERDLDVPRLRLQREQRDSVPRAGEVPFVSVPAERLAVEGFVVREGADLLWRAPDAAVLLSDEFLHGHCLYLVPSRPGAEGLLGLAFRPARSGGPTDIQGVLWISPETSELQHLEYQYTDLSRLNLGVDLRSVTLGGRVEFERLPTGEWISSRWWIRMPRIGENTIRIGAVTERRREVVGIREEGGYVVGVTDARGTPLRRSDDRRGAQRLP